MIKKIKFRRLILSINICIVLLLIIIIIKNLKYSKKKIEYEQKIANLQQASINFSESIEKEDKEIKTYYVSADGISNDGTDINNPMSLNEANKKTYYGNEKVLFKRGDIFYGVINFNVDATDEKMFYIGTYGESEEKPIISGANILVNSNAWVYDEEGLYKIDLSNYSNFYGIGRTYWQPYNIGFLEDENGNIYGKRKKSKELLEDENDFYCENNYLYIKSIINPSQKFGRIKFVSRNNLVRISSNTIITGLNIQDTGAHGIVKKDDELKNVYIKNCIIQNIGGSVQNINTFTRYGNGIEFWNQAENTLVENCIIRNIYDAGYTVQENTTNTGFENNICKNNIFINDTYDVEMFSYNKNDSNTKTKLTEQLINNNISINQGRGWGYIVRPDKLSASILVLWSDYSLPQDANIEIKNNTYYNYRNNFNTYVNNPITKEHFSGTIESDNNHMYMADDTTLFIRKGNYQDRSILKEYNQDQNSTFKLLTDKQIKQVSNTEILNSNDYNKIKEYYENLEKEFSYDEIKQPIIDNYNKYINENTITLSKITNATNDLNDIKNRIESTQLNTLNENILKEITDDIYTIEVNTLKANVEGKITNKEMEQTIKNLNELAHQIDNIYNKAEISNQFNKKDIEKYIEQAQERIDNCQDLNIENLSLLLNIGNDILSKEATSYADYLYATMLDTWSKSIIDKKIEQYINENPVQIEYSEQKLTNKNVIAAIKTNANIKILNNSNKRDYIFKENGVFTFEYEIKERKLSIQAQVTNIDKTPPQITGIEQGGKYKESITPQITDENLSEVKLIKDGQEVENYKQNTAITQEGIYQLKATDKAGNETSINFVIAYPEDEKYKIENNTIKNIKGETSVETLKGKLQVDEKYTIKRKDTEIQNSDNIATGDILETESGNKYTLIVRGDLNKDGKVDIKDLVKMRKFLLLGNNLDESEEMAADTNIDGKEISIKDLVKMRIILLTQ